MTNLTQRILLRLLAGVILVAVGSGEAQAIPTVDEFEEQHGTNYFESPFGIGGSTNNSERRPNEANLESNILGDQRDVDSVIDSTSVTVFGDFAEAVSSGDNLQLGRYVFQVRTGGGASITATDKLTYDGGDGDGDGDIRAGFGVGVDTDGDGDKGFNPVGLNSDTDITAVDTDLDSSFGFDVRAGSNSRINNVFLLRDFNITSGKSIDINIELFDEDGDSVSVVDAEATGGKTTDFFTLNDSDNGNVRIALTEDDITSAGIDTDGRYFEENTNFDFTQVTGIRYQGRLSASGNETITASMDSMGFEAVPFEAESSIGIALLGAWGAWKRWQSKAKAKAEQAESN